MYISVLLLLYYFWWHQLQKKHDSSALSSHLSPSTQVRHDLGPVSAGSGLLHLCWLPLHRSTRQTSRHHGIQSRGKEYIFLCTRAKSLQSCPTLCDPMGCSPPGFSVHGISQARILEWVGISFSSRSFQPRDQTCVTKSLFHY